MKEGDQQFLENRAVIGYAVTLALAGWKKPSFAFAESVPFTNKTPVSYKWLKEPQPRLGNFGLPRDVKTLTKKIEAAQKQKSQWDRAIKDFLSQINAKTE